MHGTGDLGQTARHALRRCEAAHGARSLEGRFLVRGGRSSGPGIVCSRLGSLGRVLEHSIEPFVECL